MRLEPLGTPFFVLLVVVSALVLGFAQCGGSNSSEPESSSQSENSELSLEAQIGPVTHVELGLVDAARVAAGKRIFTLRCTACHQLERVSVGPPLAGILKRRSPEYVMNMIMNPTEMLENHPDAKAMLAEYAVPMADLGISESDARAILEYLR